MKCRVVIEKEGSGAKVTVSGVIDEDMDFQTAPLVGYSNLELYLGDVKGINSCGIREWIRWVGTAKDKPVIYHQCSKIIVDQINMVRGFLPEGGRVASFYVPYFNEDSGEEKNILFREGVEYQGADLKPPANILDNAGNEMEMDVVEAKYFKFLKG